MLRRSPPVRPPAVLRSTASGISPAAGLGKRTRPAPDWCRPASAVRPSAPRTKPRRTEPSVRGSQAGGRPLASIVQAPIATSMRGTLLHRQMPPDITLHHVGALAGEHHLAALHDGVGVGQFARSEE